MPKLRQISVPQHFPDAHELLSAWRWLIGDQPYDIVLVSIFGDPFLQDEQGQVYWLDVGEGELEETVDTLEAFRVLLKDEKQYQMWFMPDLAAALIEAGKELQPRQVYSYLKLPIIGGTFEPENFAPADLSVHLFIAGQIHRQVKDLPDGTRVHIKPAPREGGA